MEERSYKPGQEVYYHSNGESYKVRVLENNSGSDVIKYKFEVLEITRRSFQRTISGKQPMLSKGQIFNVEEKVSTYFQRNSEGLLHLLEK